MSDFKITEVEKEMILASRKVNEEAAKRGKLNEEFVMILMALEGLPISSDSIDCMAAMSILFFKRHPEVKEKFLDLAYEITSKADE